MVADCLPGSCVERVPLSLLSPDLVRFNEFMPLRLRLSCVGTAE